jgi:hypothetical protein
MKRFITSLAGFTIILAILITIIEIGLLYRPNVYAYKHQYLDTHADDIKVLLLGSSHIEEGIRPELIGEGTFNLAISARLKEYDAELAKMYVPQMKNLQTIVLPLDYTTFYFGRVKHVYYIGPEGSLISTCRCMHTKYMGTRIDPFWRWSEVLNSKLNFMSRFWNVNEQVLRECDSLGYVRLDIKDRKAGWEQLAKPAEMDSNKEINQKDYQEQWDIYESVAKVTQKHGVRLLLITTPVNEYYQKAMNDTMLNDIYQFAHELQQKYPNVEFHDFFYADGLVDDDFHDASHLNDSGAVKFSKLLSEVIHAHHPQN